MSQEVKLDEETDDGRPKYYMDGNDNAIRIMMGREGFVRTSTLKKADYVLFTGGPDILPLLYGEGINPKTAVSFNRDMKDISLLRRCKRPMYQSLLGICRGAQFLNVMVGNGSLYQHVDNHDKGYHDAVDNDGNVIRVSSTHHQMMVPGGDGKVLLKAFESTIFEADTWEMGPFDPKEMDNPECIFYVDHNTLCYQPHPEHNEPDNKACRTFFFDTIKENLMSGKHERAVKEFKAKLGKRKAA